MKIRTCLCAVALLLTGTLTHPHSFKLGSIDIDHPYARATGTGQRNGGAYLSLANHGADDRLLSVSADIAASVQMHSMSMEGDVMKMRQVEAIDVPAGTSVALKPGGDHVMFVGLKAPLKAGDKFPMKLKFEKAGEVEVTVNVEATGTSTGAAPMQHDH